jgi:hypothetical protein
MIDKNLLVTLLNKTNKENVFEAFEILCLIVGEGKLELCSRCKTWNLSKSGKCQKCGFTWSYYSKNTEDIRERLKKLTNISGNERNNETH